MDSSNHRRHADDAWWQALRWLDEAREQTRLARDRRTNFGRAPELCPESRSGGAAYHLRLAAVYRRRYVHWAEARRYWETEAHEAANRIAEG